jgi:hypothetical protein
MMAASATKRMSRMIRCMATSTGCCGPWWYPIKKTRGYLFSRPSDPTPVPKNSFVEKVGDIYCGVGYYK